MVSERTTRWRAFRRGLLLGTVVGGVVAARLFRVQARAMVASFRPYERRPYRPQKPVLIINRWSGGGKAEKHNLADAAAQYGIETVMLERGDDLVELAEAAVERGADALGMAGGDGSLGLVAGVAAAHDIPFFCVPVGTRNHFALDVGLDRDNPLAALESIWNGVVIRIDHGMVGDRPFLNNVSLGLYPEAVKQDGYRDAKIATFLSVASAPPESDSAHADIRFRTPDGEEHESSPMVLVSNNPYAMSGPPDFGRRVRLDGGRLGITAMLADAAASSRAHILSRHRFEEWVDTSLRIDSSAEALDVGIDGESISMPTPIEILTRNRSLQVLVPAGARPGFRPPITRGLPELDDLVDLSGEPDD